MINRVNFGWIPTLSFGGALNAGLSPLQEAAQPLSPVTSPLVRAEPPVLTGVFAHHEGDEGGGAKSREIDPTMEMIEEELQSMFRFLSQHPRLREMAGDILEKWRDEGRPKIEDLIEEGGDVARIPDRYYHERVMVEETLGDAERAKAYLSGAEDEFMNGMFTFEGNFGEAPAKIDRAIELDPNSAWGFLFRGQFLMKQGRFEEALVDFDRAIELDPGNDAQFLHRARTLTALSRHEEALDELNRLIEKRPCQSVFLDRARAKMRLGQWLDAAEDFIQGRKIIAPNDFWIGSGLLQFEFYDYEKFLADVVAAVGSDSESAFAHYFMAIVKQQFNLLEEAAADLDHAISLIPNFLNLYEFRGSLRRLLGRSEQAIADFDEAIRIMPPDLTGRLAINLRLRGETKRELGRLEEAEADFALAATLDEAN